MKIKMNKNGEWSGFGWRCNQRFLYIYCIAENAEEESLTAALDDNLTQKSIGR